jgi:hypothetical protein
MMLMGNVEGVGFIERQRLDQVGMTLEDFSHSLRDGTIASKILSDADRSGTQEFRAYSGHGRAHSESPRLVRSSTNDRAVALPRDDHGLARSSGSSRCSTEA